MDIAHSLLEGSQMDAYQGTERIKNAKLKITEGQLTGLLGTRIAIAKAIALAECERLPNGAPNINDKPNDINAIREDTRLRENNLGTGAFKIKPHYAASGKAEDLKGKGWLRQALALSKASKAAGAGNCMEQAAYVYCKLYRLGYFPIELVKLPHVKKFVNHGMIVIGLPPRTKPPSRNPRLDKEELTDYVKAADAADAVICDPWMMMLLLKDGTKTEGAYTISEYVSLVDKYVVNWVIERKFLLEHS
jgi:hypothetical protein